MYIYDSISLNYSWNENFSDKSGRENQNTYFTFKNVSPESCHLWHNVIDYDIAGQVTDDNIILLMRFACWITNATDRHSQYVILIAFPRRKWLSERPSMLRLYVYCLSYLLTGCKHAIVKSSQTESRSILHFAMMCICLLTDLLFV
jgi:hypothetical protein